MNSSSVKSSIEARVQSALNALGTEGIRITGPIAAGTQCDIAKCTLDLDIVSMDILKEIVAARVAHEMMDKANDTIHNINEYRRRAQEMVKEKSREELTDYAYDTCRRFLHRSTRERESAGKRPVLVGAVRVYKKPGMKVPSKIRALMRQVKRESIWGAGFPAEPGENIVYTVFGKKRITILEYFPGLPRRHLYRLTVSQYVKVGADIAAALCAFHRRGIIHRDVKPGNILVHQTRFLREVMAKIADLGNIVHDISKASDLTRTRDEYILATSAYAAPEQLMKKVVAGREGLKREEVGVDHRADIFSLGGTIYNLVTGLLPNQTYFDKGSGDIDKKVLEKRRSKALLDNLMLMAAHAMEEPRPQKKSHIIRPYDKPVSIRKLRSSYREVMKETRNPLRYIMQKLKKPGLAKKLRNLEMVLAGAMNIRRDRRYSTTEQMLHDLKLVSKRKRPTRVFEIVEELGTHMNSYIKETFAKKNPGVDTKRPPATSR